MPCMKPYGMHIIYKLCGKFRPRVHTNMHGFIISKKFHLKEANTYKLAYVRWCLIGIHNYGITVQSFCSFF